MFPCGGCVAPPAPATGIRPALREQRVRATASTLAVCARFGGELGLPVALAVSFAQHLLRERAADAFQRSAIVLSVDRDAIPNAAGLYPVLHLITRGSAPTGNSADLVDVALWECAPPAEVCAWYGDFVPGAGALREQVSALLALLRDAREGRLGKSANARALEAVLQDRVFDGRFALDYVDLIEHLIDTRNSGRAPSAETSPPAGAAYDGASATLAHSCSTPA